MNSTLVPYLGRGTGTVIDKSQERVLGGKAMSESLECIGSESNMQIPSETRSKPHTLRTQTQLREWRVGELVVEFANAGALQRLL